MSTTSNEVSIGEKGSNPSSDSKTTSTSGKVGKLERIARKLLVLPYIFGTAWTCLHPVVSVLTGETKCRGWFLDEHSIEMRFVDSKAGGQQHSLQIPEYLKPKRIVEGTSLCDNLRTSNHKNLVCHHHGEFFEVAVVSPLSNAVDASEEGLVVVLPPLHMSTSDNKNSGQEYSKLHKGMLQALEYLADPIATPWLAKTLFVVTPKVQDSNTTLETTVESFLNAYLGHPSLKPEQVVHPLPPKLSTAILRNLIVLDVKDSSTHMQTSRKIGGETMQQSGKSHLAILPQGRNGILPNADLVFLVGMLLDRTHFNNPRLYPQTGSTFLTHGYTKESIQAASFIDEIMKKEAVQSVFPKDVTTLNRIKQWANEFVNTLLFARTMAFGPTPPHAAALDRGIDSLTIKVEFVGKFRRDPAEELMQYILEYLVRSLGNLHERLHHSFTLYLLPTPRKFVSHMEYFLPNVLILFPLAVRAFVLLLPNILEKSEEVSRRQRVARLVQFGLCVLSALVLVPLAFAHTSLSYLPSLLVTPLVAFSDYASFVKSKP